MNVVGRFPSFLTYFAGNGGTDSQGKGQGKCSNVDIKAEDFPGLIKFAKENNVSGSFDILVVV